MKQSIRHVLCVYSCWLLSWSCMIPTTEGFMSLAPNMRTLLVRVSDTDSDSDTDTDRTNLSQRKTSLHSQVNDNIDDPVLELPLLQAQLLAKTSSSTSSSASSSMSDAQRTELSTKIEMAQTAGEFGVRKAQVEFYNAFATQDNEAMARLWYNPNDANSDNNDNEDDPCQCIHPGMACIHGRTAILQSWAMLFQNADAFEIEPADTTMTICGSTAICRCVETIGGGGNISSSSSSSGSEGAGAGAGNRPQSKLEALNIYRREKGAWKLTLHMASPIAFPSSRMG